MSAVAGWYEDPAGRHERRYWDGSQWTDQAADGSLVLLDPLAAPVATPVAAATRGPVGLPSVPPRAFAPYTRVAGGLVETSYVGVGDDGLLSVTGRIVPARHQRAYRIASPIAGLVSFVAVLVGLGFLIASTASDDPASATSGSSGSKAAAWVLIGTAMVLSFGLIVWQKIATAAAVTGTVTVPAAQVSAVRVGHNPRQLWWMLLIGVFALIPFFASRKVLRLSVPMDGPAQPTVRLMMREITRGDAELVATRLRMAGAR